MAWGRCRGCESRDHMLTTFQALLNSLRSEAQDLRDEMRKLDERHAGETRALVDRVMALTSPAAALAMHPRVPREQVRQGVIRPQFPGFEPDLRPPSPKKQDPSAPVGAIPSQDKKTR